MGIRRAARCVPTLAAWLIAVCALLGANRALAGGGPENLFLVVNSSSWASQAVANEYVRLRQIPASNLLYIAWDGGFDEIDVNQFRERLLGPILKTIEQRGLSEQIDYIVYSSDFPYAINFKEDLQGQKLPKQLVPLGSINSLTYLFQLTMSRSTAGLLNLRDNQYMRAAKDRQVAQAVHGFRAWYGWGPAGELLEAGGSRYVLSTMLAATSGRGNSVGEAIDYLRRAAKADGTFPTGTIYYMNNEDVRATTRVGSFAAAIADLNKIGVKAMAEQEKVPVARSDVQGLMVGTADFDWRKAASTIRPGAICEHLTSSGGALGERADQTPLTEFLRFGAAGSSGAVIEPYAIAEKFPVPAMQFYYASGCSLAEAYYQSVFGPYQLLIVGDPLCRPWANIPQVKVDGLAADVRLKGRVEIRARYELSTAKHAGGDKGTKVDRFELFVDGKRALRGVADMPLSLDTSGFADGYHELRFVAIDSGPIETQGRASVPVWFDNNGHSIEFSAEPSQAVRWDQKLILKAQSPGMQGLAFMHNGRLIGKLNQSQGQVEINPRLFGTGRVQLQAIGLSREGATDFVHSRPIEIDIQAARLLAGLKTPDFAKLQEGMLLTLADDKPVPVYQTLAPNWLAEAKVKAGDRYRLEGYFQIARAEIYQFQLWHNGNVKLSVDGSTLYDGAGGDYRERFVPVALAAGLHRLQIVGQAEAKPKLRILSGSRGTRSLDGNTFRHVGQ